jgi:peptidoglycan hydrolase-like protein with peptidoglycan-binding domain
MALEFSGPATSMTDAAVEDAAHKIGCPVAAVRAVLDVESRGGFLADGRPKILFERAYFCRLTGGKYNQSNPGISATTWGGYRGGPAEYDRLEEAISLDRDAALRSASWGAFQIMGNNFSECGFGNVDDFVSAMVAGEPEQLDAFVSFVKSAHLDDELTRLDWAAFARGYNGPQYKANKYDLKLAAAYNFHVAGGARTNGPQPVLKMGDTGDDVSKLQAALHVTVDGDFGPATKTAVVSFQQGHNLYPDGLVGPATWAALGVD